MRQERKRAAQGHVYSTDIPTSRSKRALPRTAASHKTRQRGPRSTSSQHRGVTQHRRTKKWEAHIWDARKQMYLGGYSSEECAARAHDIMALKCRGLDSTLNYDKRDYAFLEDKLDSLSKDDVRIMLLEKDTRLSNPSWAAEYQAHAEDEHDPLQQQRVTYPPQNDPAEGITNMQQDLHGNQIALPDSFVAIHEDMFFSDDPDAQSVDNDSSTSDVCSLAEPILQDWTNSTKRVTNNDLHNDKLSYAQSPFVPDSLSSPLLAIDSGPSSIFGHQNSTRSHVAIDTATDLLQQSLHMHTVDKAQNHGLYSQPVVVQPDQYDCSKGSSWLCSATAPANSITESDMYSRPRQLLDMPASAHNTLHKNFINSPRALLPDGTHGHCMAKYTHSGSFNNYTNSNGNTSQGSRRMAIAHGLKAEALTSTQPGQQLETRCTSTGHSKFASRLLADVYKPPAASDSQPRFQDKFLREKPNRAYSLADQMQAFKPSMARHVTISDGSASAQLYPAIPDGLKDHTAPSSPLLLPLPRQPLFLSSFDLPRAGLVPCPASPPWYSSMRSPSAPARSFEHVSNNPEVHEAYAQQADLRAMHPW